MKRLIEFLVEVGDQTVVMGLLAFMLFSFVSGAATLIASPPSLWIFTLILGMGFFWGGLRFFTNETITKHIDADKED